MTQTPTKSATLRKLMRGRSGADINKLCAATGWQRHSVRAAISGLRKAGYTVERMPPKTAAGGTIYRIAANPPGTS